MVLYITASFSNGRRDGMVSEACLFRGSVGDERFGSVLRTHGV
jgi:hypothetical protein